MIIRDGLLLACAGGVTAVCPPSVSAQRIATRVTAVRGQSLATWGTYLGPAWGVSADVRAGRVLVTAGFLRFGPTLAIRPLRGTGPPVEITTESSVLTMTAGPAVNVGSRHVRTELAVGAGLARFTNASRAVLEGDPALLDRSNTFEDLTWLFAGAIHVDVQPWAGRVAVSVGVRGTRTGETRIVREDNLAVGTISGLYVPPVPTAAMWIDGVFGVRVTLGGGE